MIPCIVLGAGGSRRCPGGKLLKTYKARPLLSWTLSNLESSELIGEIVLVVGYKAEEVSELGNPFPKVRTVHNRAWNNGIAGSLAAGLEALPPCPGALVALGDTPFFRSETTRLVLPSEGKFDQIRYPVFQKKPGHPKYFPSWLFPEMQRLEGDEGAKELLKKYRARSQPVNVNDPGVIRDFDRPKDFIP